MSSARDREHLTPSRSASAKQNRQRWSGPFDVGVHDRATPSALGRAGEDARVAVSRRSLRFVFTDVGKSTRLRQKEGPIRASRSQHDPLSPATARRPGRLFSSTGDESPALLPLDVSLSSEGMAGR
jgi:hypothetical protein